MSISPARILNNIRKTVSSVPLQPQSADELRAIKRFVNCGLDGFEADLFDAVKKKAPHLIKDINGEEFIGQENLAQRAASGLKCLCGIPLDILNTVAEKTHFTPLYNSKLLSNHRENVLFEKQIRAAQGLYENGADFVRKHMKKGSPYPTGSCTPKCESICSPVKMEFNDLLNSAMADGRANYDTKKERLAARLISGGTALLFLGTDYYNKTIQKGKTPKEATKEQHLKERQEIAENVVEGLAQFGISAMFSRFTNSSPWASAAIGTAVGLSARFLSRLTSNMPIKRVKVPDASEHFMPRFNEYIEAVKCGNTKELFKEKHDEALSKADNKKHILSPKNLLAACVGSIAIGYALRFGKNHTSIGKQITKWAQNMSRNLESKLIKDVYADEDTLRRLGDTLISSGEKTLGAEIKGLANNFVRPDGGILLGTEYKNFLGTNLKTKNVLGFCLAPFKFVQELTMYPYKIACKIEKAIKKSMKIPVPDDVKDLKDAHGIKNIYSRFLEYEKKFGNDQNRLNQEFGNYVKEMRLLSNNNITSSKGDNSKIAVLAQVLGTGTGIWFNMNDEFNSSIRNGSTKKEASKDARLRGINKFSRMSVQVAVSGALNKLFVKQYNNSILGAGLTVLTSTVATDFLTRKLNSMPTKKMTKEELDAMDIKNQNSTPAKVVDWLAS